MRNGQVSGEVKPTSAATTVFKGGKPAVRHGDSCTLNGGENPGIYVCNPPPAVTPPKAADKTSAPPVKSETQEEAGFMARTGRFFHGVCDGWVQHSTEEIQNQLDGNIAQPPIYKSGGSFSETVGRALSQLATEEIEAQENGGGIAEDLSHIRFPLRLPKGGVKSLPEVSPHESGVSPTAPPRQTAAVPAASEHPASPAANAAPHQSQQEPQAASKKPPPQSKNQDETSSGTHGSDNHPNDKSREGGNHQNNKDHDKNNHNDDKKDHKNDKKEESQGGGGGVTIAGPAKSDKCGIKPYKDLKCPKGQQAHHIVPDYTQRYGARKDTTSRIPGSVALDDGPSICLSGGSKVAGTEHHKAHFGTDPRIASAGGRTDNGPVGAATMGELIDISVEEVSKVRPECSEEIKSEVDKAFKNVNRNQLGRTTQQVSKGETRAALERGETHMRGQGRARRF